LTTERSELYRRIDRRVDEMMNKGLVEEVKGLMQREYSLSLPSMSGIGYKQVGDFLLGKMELSETIERIKYKTHCLARHQYAWFHPNDARIHWLDVDDAREKAKDLIQGFLS
jgi:tRNA dimethylallyltransferase